MANISSDVFSRFTKFLYSAFYSILGKLSGFSGLPYGWFRMVVVMVVR
jgi:hypothetical protein